MDAGEDDDLGLGGLRLLRELEAVADEVGQVLDLRILVVVSQDDRIQLALQPLDLGEEIERRGDRGGVRSTVFIGQSLACWAGGPTCGHLTYSLQWTYTVDTADPRDMT